MPSYWQITLMNKVLLAINNQVAENAYKTKLAEKSSDYEVVGCMVSQESVVDFLAEDSADILILLDGLPGKGGDSFVFARNLKRKYPSLRIIFMTGERKPGDQDLAKLVSFQIYDILASGAIKLNDMVAKTLTPTTWEEASIYLPNGGADDIFTKDEMAQTEQGNQTQVTETETVVT